MTPRTGGASGDDDTEASMPVDRNASKECSSSEVNGGLGEPTHGGPLKVSVVVPVYNPGRYIDECIASLLRQTMPATDFEVVFVDDGSTDDTPRRLDALAARHDHIHVIHQENSGWPGKPRNVGIDNARGEYVLFMDNDDWLGDEALERMYAYAAEHGSDILIPRYVGHGRSVARELFNTSVPRTTLRKTPQVIDSMTPHKLVRRAFIAEHGLRFPEGRRRLEDHVFFIEAYLLAETISILSDYPCYHHVNRDDHGNAARSPYDPKVYFAAVREVLDIIDKYTEPDAFRDRLYMRWYGTELMGRVDRGTFFRYPEEFQERLFDEVHRLSLERFGEHLIERFGATRRVRAHLIRNGDLDDYRAFLRHDLRVRVRTWLTAARWTERNTLELELAGRLEHADAPLFRARDGRVTYHLPGDVGARVPESATTVTEEALKGRVRLVLHGRASEVEYMVPLATTLSFVPIGDEPGRDGSEDQADDGRCLAFTGTAEIDPRTAAAGSRLPDDVFELRVRVTACSWSIPAWVAWPEEHRTTQSGPTTAESRIVPVGSSVRADDVLARLGVRNGRRTVLRIVTEDRQAPRPVRSGGWRGAARRIRRGLRRRVRRLRAGSG